MKETKTFIFMGRPGCGKGTQMKLLHEKLSDYEIFALGEQFRSLGTEDTFLGKKIKSIIDAGFLAPHWFASYLFKQKILHLPPERGILFEGTARKIAEAQDVHEVMEWLERSYRVIHLEVPVDVIKKRLEERGKSSNREDDHVKSIDVRLGEYEKYTEPAITFLRDKSLVIDIDGTKPIEEAHADIMAALEKLP